MQCQLTRLVVDTCLILLQQICTQSRRPKHIRLRERLCGKARSLNAVCRSYQQLLQTPDMKRKARAKAQQTQL